MSKKLHPYLFAYLFFGIFAANVAHALAPSQYGQIQNVQKYSTNHFYNGQYNQKAPQAIYATGTDLTTGDCQRVVENLIVNECSGRNNCFGMRVSDIRPILMVRLSQLPGHNFATSCGGYIDTIFADYLTKTGSNTGNTPQAVAFPTTSGVRNNNTGVQFGTMVSPHQQAVAERAAELAEAHRQNETMPVGIVATDFPKSYDDLSLSDRMAVTAEGLEPFKDLEAYHPIDVESYQDYLARTRPAKTSGSGNPATNPNNGQTQPGNSAIVTSGCQTGDSPECAITLVLN